MAFWETKYINFYFAKCRITFNTVTYFVLNINFKHPPLGINECALLCTYSREFNIG